jgi:hypothetical protein
LEINLYAHIFLAGEMLNTGFVLSYFHQPIEQDGVALRFLAWIHKVHVSNLRGNTNYLEAFVFLFFPSKEVKGCFLD